MVLPFIIAGLVAGATALIPKIVSVTPKVVSFIGTKVLPKVVTAIPKVISAAPKIVKGTLVTSAVAGVVSTGVAPLILKSTYRAGKVTGKVIKGETTLGEGVKEVGKTAGLILGGGLLATGGGLLAKEIIDNKKEKEAEAVAETNNFIPSSPQVAQEVVPEKTIQTNEGVPITPETQTITTGQKRRRKAKAKTSPIIRNSVKVVNVNHSVGAINKKYIKVEQLI